MGDVTLVGTGEVALSATQSIVKFFIPQMDLCAKMTSVTVLLTTPKYVTHTIGGEYAVTNLAYHTIGNGMRGQFILRFQAQDAGIVQTGTSPVKNYWRNGLKVQTRSKDSQAH